jgi:hypothetical protein
LIPSPQWRSTGNGTSFGFQWQVTPLLFSYGINNKISPWRFFVVDPVARQSGSFEFYFSPEYFNHAEEFKNKWIFSFGSRVYFPLWQRGEYLSVSAGVSYFNFNGINGLAYEAGFYLFAGFVGFQTSYAPDFTESKWRFTIRLRAF